jgi:hypothetical protein
MDTKMSDIEGRNQLWKKAGYNINECRCNDAVPRRRTVIIASFITIGHYR